MSNNTTIESTTNLYNLHHANFYLPDGSCIFSVEGVLYKLPVSLLGRHSEIFNYLRTLPPTSNAEGTSDTNPVILHGIKCADFDHLLEFLFRVFTDDGTETLDYLLSVLKLSMLWDIKVGKEYAILRLSNRKDIKHSLKLHLALKYKIDDWIEPTFRLLVAKNCEAIDIDDAMLIGVEVYHILTQTKFQIQKERAYIAYSAPDVVHAEKCPDVYKCKVDWEKSWWNGFCRHFLHPDRILTCETALAKLEAARLKE